VYLFLELCVFLFAWTTDLDSRLILVPQSAYSTMSRGAACVVYLPGSWRYSSRLCQAASTYPSSGMADI